MSTNRNGEWLPELPTSNAPEDLQYAIRHEAHRMSQELRERYLRVILIPAPDPSHNSHKIRAVEEQNPDWYRELWHANAYRRKGKKWRTKTDSTIKRTRVQRALEHIAEGTDRSFHEMPPGSALPWIFSYQTLLRSLIYERLQEGNIANNAY
ncbi:hypothetical protein HYW11_03000 [Candidatus Peregrinibacteria bacterium]|nr:hypothetical protein [Candidatus Peregrinibacteria bacterium]